MSSRYDVVVIGAGHNGLTAATLLAKQGRRVVVLERRDQIGGLAVSEEFHPGYRTAGVLHDTTAVRPWIVDQLDLGQHGLELLGEPPPTLLPRRSEAAYLHWRNPARAEEEIGKISSNDAASYRRYRNFIKRITPVVRRIFDDFPPDTEGLSLGELWGLGKKALSLRLLGKTDMMELFRIAPMCVADWVGEWFETEVLRAAVAAPAVLHGLTGPWSPGTNLNLLLAETQASRSVKGGPAALIAALERAAVAAGVEIRTGGTVARIALQDGSVSGVTLRNGETLEAPKVAAACDPKHLFLDLLPPALLPLELERNVSLYRTRGTVAKINLALRTYPEFSSRLGATPAFVRTGESIDELERAFDAAKYRQISAEPVLDIFVPTVESPELAPPGHHVFSMLVHWVPYTLEGGWTDEAKGRLVESTLDTLSIYAPAIRQAVVGMEVLSPVDLESIFGVSGGHLLHGEHALDQLLLRPTPECARYKTPFGGLYLCGGGSHPGGGITCAPGALASRAILGE